METGKRSNFTPEQIAKMKQYKSNNTVETNKNTAQQTNQRLIQQPIQSSTQQPIQNNENNNFDYNFEQKKAEGLTYFEHINPDNSKFEIDLVTFREKGVETRYLSLYVYGVDTSKDSPVPSQTTVSIGSREEFEKFKSFIEQLNWGD